MGRETRLVAVLEEEASSRRFAACARSTTLDAIVARLELDDVRVSPARAIFGSGEVQKMEVSVQ